jgi:hypothetical protein
LLGGLEGKLAEALALSFCDKTVELFFSTCPVPACLLYCVFSVLEGKLAEARSKKDTLKARAASAKTSKQIQEMVGNLNTSNAVVAFDKMEEKVSLRGAAHSVGLMWRGSRDEQGFCLVGSAVQRYLS